LSLSLCLNSPLRLIRWSSDQSASFGAILIEIIMYGWFFIQCNLLYCIACSWKCKKNKINGVFFNQMVFVNSLLLIQYRVFINTTFLGK
jgi:hypothetical protein